MLTLGNILLGGRIAYGLLSCVSYSPQSEILEYFKAIASKYNLYKNIKLNKQVVRAAWIEAEGIWDIEVQDKLSGEVVADWCHVLINATGILK